MFQLIKIFIFFYFIYLTYVQEVQSQKMGLVFDGNPTKCKNFKNKVMNLDKLVCGKEEENDMPVLLVSGGITITEVIDTKYEIGLEIWKELEITKELMFTSFVNFCSSVQNTDAPWYPLTSAANCSICPLQIKDYMVDGEVKLDMSSLKDYIIPEYEGTYVVLVKITGPEENVGACFEFYLSIVEYNSDE